MEIIRLEVGREAPLDSDCINISPIAHGKLNLTGAALCGDTSVALVSEMIFDTSELAEETGIAWANLQGVETLYIATGKSV